MNPSRLAPAALWRSFLLLALTALLAVAPFAAGAQTITNLVYHFTDYTTRPLALTSVSLTPLGPADDFNQALLSITARYYTRANNPGITNGSVTFTNVISGYWYAVEFADGISVTTRTNFFPWNTNGYASLNGADYLAFPVGGVPGQRGVRAAFLNPTNITALTDFMTNDFATSRELATSVTNALGFFHVYESDPYAFGVSGLPWLYSGISGFNLMLGANSIGLVDYNTNMIIGPDGSAGTPLLTSLDTRYYRSTNPSGYQTSAQVNAAIGAANSASNVPGVIASSIAASNLLTVAEAAATYRTAAQVNSSVGVANSASNWPAVIASSIAASNLTTVATSGVIATNSIFDSAVVLNPNNFPNLARFYATNWAAGPGAPNAVIYVLADSHFNNFGLGLELQRYLGEKIGCNGSIASFSTLTGNSISTNITSGRAFSGSIVRQTTANDSVVIDKDGVGTPIGPMSQLSIRYNRFPGAGTFKLEAKTNGAAAFATLLASVDANNSTALTTAFTNVNLVRGHYTFRLTTIAGTNEYPNAIYQSFDGPGVVLLDFSYGGVSQSVLTNNAITNSIDATMAAFPPNAIFYSFADTSNEWQNAASEVLSRLNRTSTNYDLFIIGEPPSSNEVETAVLNEAMVVNQLERAFALSHNATYFDTHKQNRSWWAQIANGSGTITDPVHMNTVGRYKQFQDFWLMSGLASLNLGENTKNKVVKVEATTGLNATHTFESVSPNTSMKVVIRASTNSATTLAFENADGTTRFQITVTTNGVAAFVDGLGNGAVIYNPNTSTALNLRGNGSSGDPGCQLLLDAPLLGIKQRFGPNRIAGKTGYYIGNANGQIYQFINSANGFTGIGYFDSNNTNAATMLDVSGETTLRSNLWVNGGVCFTNTGSLQWPAPQANKTYLLQSNDVFFKVTTTATNAVF